jgi:uncharacterized protein YndB with AHSA1/START domain
MPVTDVQNDPEALTLTVIAEFDAPVARVWEMWADPRKLERWWGPPTYPATVVEHELAPGGRVSYFMTGPDGDRHHGWWEVGAVDAPVSLEFVDGFADDTGAPNADMPTMTVRVSISALGDGRTQMVIRSAFSSIEDMERLVAMGMVEGVTEAVNQIDALVVVLSRSAGAS